MLLGKHFLINLMAYIITFTSKTGFERMINNKSRSFFGLNFEKLGTATV